MNNNQLDKYVLRSRVLPGQTVTVTGGPHKGKTGVVDMASRGGSAFVHFGEMTPVDEHGNGGSRVVVEVHFDHLVSE